MNDVTSTRMRYFRPLVGGVFGLPREVTVNYGDFCTKWHCGKLHGERHWYAGGLAAQTGLSLQRVSAMEQSLSWEADSDSPSSKFINI